MNVRGLLEVPNLLSLLRIVLIPVFLYFIFIPTMEHRLWALVIFIIASVTDFLDGWSARKLHQESDLGRFLDPLADKVLVIGALTAFLILDPFIPLWMIVIIVGRDVLITLMRYLAIRKGAALVTSGFGKVKTAFQMISIMVIIMVFVFRRAGVSRYATDEFIKIVRVYEIMTSSIPDKWLIIGPYCLMFVVTLLTALSGIRYMMTNWRLFFPPYSKRDSAS
ncbi:MAG TPA: CDP-diacylglycerol--glycerol-3-phosphate 3-phosphatidyltransferase [Spirochaetota bacterium]|nr:CDP-diacylglycerol--glycerol-3-phosphate 3-phosphatidyltransferase [Spirochaetota bacterium]OPZ38479.1 MAG: CDP-diacylglycerol--glycerol-3-phosphate 3-phosphatidyltransferase [Spirochaetes bacterium ADurb.BinA120]HNU91006.1 CDP-diacylglycerol--glycerol-3-phosphate 3-phosphatidyltransferase [Spirochaetota bacterium]HPI13368.1 CDP-diacylglycerol--glycerol-3-phosphate 3-phosphatidyltransferase [Spirochaetota bacterium]HPO44595.1 CDP-diacylglycerol--glycerol-3-phosphate 3-phosphatidyltransferase